jgi:hypothetical protein
MDRSSYIPASGTAWKRRNQNNLLNSYVQRDSLLDTNVDCFDVAFGHGS